MSFKIPVLVAAPTYQGKDYCFEIYIDRAMSLYYPDYDLFLVDNSPDLKYYEKLSAFSFSSAHLNDSQLLNPIERIEKSLEVIRHVAIERNYEYLLILETDVIPPKDIIIRLLDHNVPVVSGVYFIGHGENSMLCSWLIDQTLHKDSPFPYDMYSKDQDLIWADGTLRRVHTGAFGCCLIRKDIFSQFPFRTVAGSTVKPDGWFFNDLYNNDVPVYQDTSLWCEHKNQNWQMNPEYYKII